MLCVFRVLIHKSYRSWQNTSLCYCASFSSTLMFNTLTPRSFWPKPIFRTFWTFLAWWGTKLAPMYSKRHLQQNSMPFFSTRITFYDNFCSGMRSGINFSWTRKWSMAAGFSPFIFLLFLSFCCNFSFLLGLPPVQESPTIKELFETENSYPGVAKCSWRTLCSEIITQISKHFRAYFMLS